MLWLQASHLDKLASPWIGSGLRRLQGSEVDIEEESAAQSRPGLLVLARRARQHFRRPCVLSDKDSAELWNSSQAGCQMLLCCAYRQGPCPTGMLHLCSRSCLKACCSTHSELFVLTWRLLVTGGCCADVPQQAPHHTFLMAMLQMEVRPFRDSNYDLRRVEQDMAVQAVVVVQDTGVQATGGQVRRGRPAWCPMRRMNA